MTRVRTHSGYFFDKLKPAKPKADGEMPADRINPISKSQTGKLIAEPVSINIFETQITRTQSWFIINANIKQLSARHNVTHERLSVAIGMPADTIVKLFNNEISPSIHLLHNIARFYNTTIYALMTCTEEFPSTQIDEFFTSITPKEQWSNYFENIKAALNPLGFGVEKFERIAHVHVSKSDLAVINPFEALEIAESLNYSLEKLLDIPKAKSDIPRIRIIPPTITKEALATNTSIGTLRNNVITLAHHRGVSLEVLAENIGAKAV